MTKKIINTTKIWQEELDFNEFDEKSTLVKDNITDNNSDNKFNDKNIFTGKYEKPLLYKSKPMSEEDKEKFTKLNENLKLKIVETLLDNEENTKIMESNMENILKELYKFKVEVAKMKEDKIEENNERIAREKKVKTSNDETIDSLFIEMCTITTKLKDILIDRKMSQTELCERTGISRSTMSYILSNADTMNLKNAFKISKVLNIPLEDIFQFDISIQS